jgi:hypothetical protein
MIEPCGLLAIFDMDAAYIYPTDERLPPGRDSVSVDPPEGMHAYIVLDWKDNLRMAIVVQR